MEHKRIYLLACTSGKTNAWPPVFVFCSKQVHTSWILDFKIFDSKRLITDVEKRPAL